MHTISTARHLAGSLVALLLLATTGRAATILLTASDTGGQSSFNTGVHWSDTLAPSAGNDYTAGSARVIRTPSTGGNFSFAGDSLTLSGGSRITIKSTTSGATQTVSNLILDNGSVEHNVVATFGQTLAGNVSLGSGGGQFFVTVTPTSGTQTTRFNITAPISGAGALRVYNNNGGSFNLASQDIISLSANNAYTGGTFVGIGTNAQPVTLEVTTTGTLGSGPVTLLGAANASAANATLKLSSLGNLADTTFLNLGDALNTNWAVNLGFTGVDTIAGLDINGTLYGSGTFGAIGSGADFTFANFTGVGMLSVVPEPATWGLLLCASLGFLARRRLLAHF